jgi:hypothetical protein
LQNKDQSLARKVKKIEPVTYIRTHQPQMSAPTKTATNDSGPLSNGYAKRAGFVLIDQFNDAV